MKIMQIIPNLNTGGAEIMLENLSIVLANKHSVVVVSLYNQKTYISRRLEEKGIRIVFLDKKSHIDLSLGKKLRTLLYKEKPDVIHSHLYVIPYVILGGGLKYKIVHTFHSLASKEQTALGQIITSILIKIGLVTPVAISPQVKQSILERYHVASDRVPIVFNGVDLNKCKKNSVKHEDFVFTNVARLSVEKNHKLLINAFYLYSQQNPNAKLWLVGDGVQREDIECVITEYDLNGKIKLFGNVEDVFSILCKSDVFILTSLYEGMPMSIIEALGSSLPVIATAVGGIPDMITDGVEGFLTSFECEEIVASMKRIAEDKQLREDMRCNAYRTSYKFSAETMAESYVLIYKDYYGAELC